MVSGFRVRLLNPLGSILKVCYKPSSVLNTHRFLKSSMQKMKMKGNTMKISDCLPKFLSYLTIEKASMPSTLADYKREVERLILFLEGIGSI